MDDQRDSLVRALADLGEAHAQNVARSVKALSDMFSAQVEVAGNEILIVVDHPGGPVWPEEVIRRLQQMDLSPLERRIQQMREPDNVEACANSAPKPNRPHGPVRKGKGGKARRW